MKRSGVTISPEPVIVRVFVERLYSQVMSVPQVPEASGIDVCCPRGLPLQPNR